MEEKLYSTFCNGILFSKYFSVIGYVHGSIEYLKDLIPRLKAGEELACLAFDEMHLTEKAEWDRKTDAILGPNRQANVFMIRSLYGNWKMPVYIDFEPTKDPNAPKLPKGTKKLPKIPKFLLMQIIVQLVLGLYLFPRFFVKKNIRKKCYPMNVVLSMISIANSLNRIIKKLVLLPYEMLLMAIRIENTPIRHRIIYS